MYRKTVLENGIRVITETCPSVRSVAMGILADAGPQNEAPQNAGVAHLTEHLFFQGTSNRTARQIARVMDLVGGQIGAFTTRDYTCFFASVLDEHLTYALDLMGDLLLNSIFPADKLEMEKNAILREIESTIDSPELLVHDLLKSFIWKDHPLGRAIAGTPESVATLTREDAIYFVHDNFLPDKLVIAAAGSLDHEDFVAQVRDAFWRMIRENHLPVAPPHPPPQRSGVVIRHTPIHLAYFSIGIPAFPFTSNHRYKMHMLSKILGGGVSSRLFCLIREQRGLVYQITSEYHAYRQTGILVIEGYTAPECLLTVLKLILSELYLLAYGEKPIDDEELWMAKMNLRGQHILESENMQTRMSRLSTQEFYFGQHISAQEVIAAFASLDSAAMADFVSEYLPGALPQLAVAVVGPEKPDAYSREKIEALMENLRP